LDVIDMLPPKIMLIFTICSSLSETSQRCSPRRGLGVPALLEAASFCDPEKFCTLPDHVNRCDGFRTTSLRRQGVRRVSFPSNLSIVFHGSGILCGPSDLLIPQC
jgi:hypothetical protein